MKAQFKRFAVISTGWIFLVLGILGFFLPILQGFLFTFIGLALLSTEYVWAHNLLGWLKRKFPRFGAVYDAAIVKSREWLRRLRRPVDPVPADPSA